MQQCPKKFSSHINHQKCILSYFITYNRIHNTPCAHSLHNLIYTILSVFNHPPHPPTPTPSPCYANPSEGQPGFVTLSGAAVWMRGGRRRKDVLSSPVIGQGRGVAGPSLPLWSLLVSAHLLITDTLPLLGWDWERWRDREKLESWGEKWCRTGLGCL